MQIISKYFSDLTEQQTQQISQLQPLYSHWNEQINVVSRKDIDNLYENHILHSLALAKVIAFLPDAQVLDLGTGGGLPGIPLAILFPQTKFLLVDSIGKKIKVVEAIAKELGLSNVQAQHSRAENLPKQRFDFVLARAVTALPDLWKWSKGLLAAQSRHSLPNGLLTYKGNDDVLKADIAQLPPKTATRIFPLTHFIEEEFYSTKCIVWVGRG